jgi:D-amino-acid dehydrogenase
MKIAIVGAGIVGVATAWELAADGHEVAVFERRGAAAEESSFANAGLQAPACVTPWGAPGLRVKVLRSLLSTQGGIVRRWPYGPRDAGWLRRWQRECRLEDQLAQRSRLQQLALYSRARLHEIAEARELAYERTEGLLVLLRSARERKLVEPGLDALRAAGTVFRDIDADTVRQLEPALNTDTELAGAIHLPEEEAGNCRQVAQLLKRDAEALGAQFHFGCDLAPLNRAQPRALSLAEGSPSHSFDAVVVCAGVASATLLKPLGLRIPLAPVFGHSISAAIREPLNAPNGAVIDERHQVAITRLGQRVRVAGGAELGGTAGTIHPDALQTLYKVLHNWFPAAAQLDSSVQQWKGVRPTLLDGPPIVGPSGVPGVWLNLGHGANGWALACGSARLLADLVSQRDPGIDTSGLGIERFLNT